MQAIDRKFWQVAKPMAQRQLGLQRLLGDRPRVSVQASLHTGALTA
jgi:hypothetical protein